MTSSRPATAEQETVGQDALICGKQVGVSFGGPVAVLEDLDFQVHPGEFVTLLGPSGCGKSTLLRLIAGLTEPTSGQVTVAGEDARLRRRRIGIVFQDPVLLPWRSVARNIRLPLEFGAAADAESVEDLLTVVGLSAADARKRPAMLSGGMRMRVSLARALVTRPEIFLLDEPFAALDDVLRQQLNEELLQIRQRRQTTTVFVTHNVAEAVFLSQRILVLSSGPAKLAAEVSVPFGYPRDAALRGTPEFASLVQSVSESLRGANR